MPEVEKKKSVDDTRATATEQFAGVANMMAHPTAGLAAATALGLGFASQAFGAWMGFLAGAADASQRFMALGADLPGATDFARAAARARAAADQLIAEARETAEAVVETVEPKRKAPRKAAVRSQAAPDVAAKTAAPALMPEDFRRPRAIAKPKSVDDLKKIGGIGPKLEKVLNGLGVWTYAQIAAWSREEIAWVDDYLAFKGRIERDGWLDQAARLAAGEQMKK
ncbi:MAG: NADH-ubiquinone dehydrogenase [Rhizobiaceae bacterium]|nr:MAG: NADH-ubiquinone dehydrogenase [Rhizobiaceae bacterium]CAG1007492.1 NADH-quinone oxidoreductase subunit E [Rhizobiaceae bacterium]